MTEEQIEARVEARMNGLDRRFMAAGSTMTAAQYDAEIKALNRWADSLREAR